MEDLQKYAKEGSWVNLEDVIAAILGFVGVADRTAYLTRDDTLIHGTLLKLREKYAILRVFAFNEGFSPLIEEIFSRLQVATLLTMTNPDFKRYIVKAKSKRTIRRIVHTRFNEEALSMLQQIAEEFGGDCLASSQEL